MGIAYGGALGRASGSGTSVALNSLTTSGSNILVIFSILADAASTTISSISYAGTTATLLGTVDTGDGSRTYATYYVVLASGTTGNIAATLSNSTTWQVWVDYYTTVNQTTPVYNTATGGASGAITTTPTDITVASTTNGSWQFVSAKEDSAATALTVTAGSRRQVGQTGTVISAHADSNGGVNNGNNSTITLAWTGGGQRLGYVTTMIAPTTTSNATVTISDSTTTTENNTEIYSGFMTFVESISVSDLFTSISEAWRFIAKNVSSFGNAVKHTSTFQKLTKHNSSWTDQSKH